MLLFQTTFVWLSLLGLIAVHALAVFLPEKIGKYLGYANILLHIACLFLLLYHLFPIDEAVLFYMISVFFYTVFQTVKHYVLPHFCKKNEPESDENPREEADA